MVDVPPINGPTWEAVFAYKDVTHAVGIDEVGRGALAGPVVAAAVILPLSQVIDELRDSKLMTHRSRLDTDRKIRRGALAIGIGWVSHGEVDAHGLTWAVRQSGLRALSDMNHHHQLIILDGKHNYLKDDSRSIVIIKADALVTPVAAASVIAKVARDKYMALMARRYPAYSFEKHKGYGTAKHLEVLRALGVSDIHRRSYLPIRELLA